MLATTAASEYFGSSLNSNQAFIEHIYINTLGKTYLEDKEGIDYWVDLLNQGYLRNQVISTLIIAAQASENAGNAQDQFNNRVALSDYYVNVVEANDMIITSKIVSSVSHDNLTLDRAKNDLDTFKSTFASDYVLKNLSSLADTFNGTDDKEWIYANDGNDVIYTGSGENSVYGGNGDDRIYAYDKQDLLHGEADNDTIYGGADDDTIYGGSGNDSLIGNDGDDMLWGDDGNDYLYGNEGDDTLRGGDGDDTIVGDIGNDFIYGESGADWIDAGDGSNWVDSGSGDDTIFGGAGIDQLFGGEDNDILYGLDEADILDGMNGNDTLYGGNGNDTLNGNEGNDTLYGNANTDYLKGELGDDTLIGGIGADILSGGAGSDLFVFALGDSDTSNLDTIVDFAFSTTGLDQFSLPSFGTETIASSAVNVSSAVSLADALSIVTAFGDSDGTNARISWFYFEDNTYIYDDMTVGVYDATTDILIKLQGIVNLDGLDSDSFVFS